MHSVVLDLIWNIATFQSPGPWFWNPPDTPGAYPLLTGLESKDLTSTLGETFGPVAVGKSASLTAAASFPPHDSESQHFLRILNAPDHDLEYPMYLHQMMKDIEKSSHHVTSTISQPSNVTSLSPKTINSTHHSFCEPHIGSGGVLRPQGYFWNLLLHSPQTRKHVTKRSQSHLSLTYLPNFARKTRASNTRFCLWRTIDRVLPERLRNKRGKGTLAGKCDLSLLKVSQHYDWE